MTSPAKPPKSTSGEKWADPENHVGYLLKSLMHGLRQATEAALREARLELSMAHLVTLGMVKTEPGLPGAQLAKRLLITAQSMNVILRRLEQEGLVEWRTHPHNLRAHCWFIGDAGIAVLERAAEACEPVFEQMQSHLHAGEKRQLIDLLTRCIAGLQAPADIGQSTRL
jgi:DNA-binding MarR family transcriptional regulator